MMWWKSAVILDKRMDLAGHEINPGQEAQRTMALILVITGEGRMNAGFRRQVRRLASLGF